MRHVYLLAFVLVLYTLTAQEPHRKLFNYPLLNYNPIEHKYICQKYFFVLCKDTVTGARACLLLKKKHHVTVIKGRVNYELAVLIFPELRKHRKNFIGIK